MSLDDEVHRTQKRNNIEKQKLDSKNKLTDKGHPVLAGFSAKALGLMMANPLVTLGTIIVFLLAGLLYATAAFNVLLSPYTWLFTSIFAFFISRDGYMTAEEIYTYPAILAAIWFAYGAFITQQNFADAWGYGSGMLGVMWNFVQIPNIAVYYVAFMLELIILTIIMIGIVRARDSKFDLRDTFKINEMFNNNKGDRLLRN